MTDSKHHACQMRTFSVGLLAIILVAFSIRLFHLDTQPLSADEAFTVVVWGNSTLPQLLNDISLIDPQPPATLLGVVGWMHLAGNSEYATRYLSLLASMVALVSLYQITHTLTNPRIALLALLIALVNPFHIWYAQDIRSYSLWLATSGLSTLTLIKALHAPDRLTRWVLYVLATAVGLYTFYLEALFVVAQNLLALTLLAGRKQTRLIAARWIPSQLFLAALIAPWYLRPSLRSSGYTPTAVVNADIPWLFETLTFGPTLPDALKHPFLVLGVQHFSLASTLAIVLFATGTILLFLSRRTAAGWYVGLFVLVPMTLLTILTTATTLGFFRPRYLAPTSLALIVASAFTLYHLLTAKRMWQLLGAVLMIAIAGFSLSSLWNYHFREPKAPAWREIAAYLNTQPAPRDAIIRNFPDPAFDYYYTGPLPRYLLPTTPTAPIEETHFQLQKLTQQYDALWFIPVPYVAYDPDEVVAYWLRANTQLISEHWSDTTHIIQFARWDIDTTIVENSVEIAYEETAILRGYNVTPTQDSWAVGSTVTVELFWEPTRQTERLLTVFFHVLTPDNSGNLVLANETAQDDQWPQEGRVTTQTWEPGKLYRDVHTVTLPESLDGAYTIAVGFYDAETLDRIPPLADTYDILAGPNSPVLLTFTLP